MVSRRGGGASLGFRLGAMDHGRIEDHLHYDVWIIYQPLHEVSR